VTWERGAPGPASAPAPASTPASEPLAGAAARRGGEPGVTVEPVDLAGVRASFIPVGQSGDNVGIIAFNVRRYPRNKGAYEVFLEVQNFRPATATVKLEIVVAGAAGAAGPTVDLRILTIPAGQRLQQIYPNLASAGEPPRSAARPRRWPRRAARRLSARRPRRGAAAGSRSGRGCCSSPRGTSSSRAPSWRWRARATSSRSTTTASSRRRGAGRRAASTS